MRAPTPSLGGGETPSPADVREQEVQTERALAGLISDHPHISMNRAEVLDAAEYDHDSLRETAADLYPERFGGNDV